MSKRDFDSVDSNGNSDSERKRKKLNIDYHLIDHSYSKLKIQKSCDKINIDIANSMNVPGGSGYCRIFDHNSTLEVKNLKEETSNIDTELLSTTSDDNSESTTQWEIYKSKFIKLSEKKNNHNKD